jgi:very-short-patch-repair endonuclease
MLVAMAPCIERAIAERARTQLGHITDQQFRDLGISWKVVARLVASGWLVEVGRHTYRLGGVPSSFEGAVMAACLEHQAAASHRTAALLHPLETPRNWRSLPIEVTTTRRVHHATSPLAVVHTSTNLDPNDLTVVKGIPCTSVARTIMGLAALVPEVAEREVRTIVDTAIRDGHASDKWLWWRLEQLRCRGRDGVTVLEHLLSDRAQRGRTESWLEYEFLELVTNAGFPRPIVQRRVKKRGAFVARVDFLFGTDVVVEVKGRRGHTTDDEAAGDAARRNDLQARGFVVIEFTYLMVVETPHVVLAQLAEHVARP